MTKTDPKDVVLQPDTLGYFEDATWRHPDWGMLPNVSKRLGRLEGHLARLAEPNRSSEEKHLGAVIRNAINDGERMYDLPMYATEVIHGESYDTNAWWDLAPYMLGLLEVLWDMKPQDAINKLVSWADMARPNRPDFEGYTLPGLAQLNPKADSSTPRTYVLDGSDLNYNTAALIAYDVIKSLMNVGVN